MNEQTGNRLCALGQGKEIENLQRWVKQTLHPLGTYGMALPNDQTGRRSRPLIPWRDFRMEEKSEVIKWKKSYRVLEEIRIEDMFFLFITVFLELPDKLTFSFVYADPQVTPEQLDAYKLPLKRRYYCAYMYIKFLDCRRNNNWPYTPCDIVFSDFEACENEE